MTIEAQINDVWMSDLRDLSTDFGVAFWEAERDERREKGKTRTTPASGAENKRKDRPDLKDKASRLLDLMISLGEIERRGGRKGS